MANLSGSLSKQESKLLARSTGYIPKSIKTAKKTLIEDSTDWGWPNNKDSIDVCLTRCCNKDYSSMTQLQKRTEIFIKKADKCNAFVALTIPQNEARANIQLKKHITVSLK